MKKMNHTDYLLALQTIDGLGPIRLKAILEYFKDPKLAWEADVKQFLEIGIPRPTIELLQKTRKKLNPPQYVQSIKEAGIKWISIFDDIYPKLLAQIYDPPVILYFKGEIDDWNSPAIAVVGTRKMTGYGRVVTERFTRTLAASGLTIVSGLARGVDAEAHWAAVRENGKTLAILGSGLNYIYPPENKSLAKEIISNHGAIISELPPDYPAMPGNFPARNRIIAGLSLGVLVTEAAEDSGSLITARLALEQGREIFAVPGPITSNLSRGPVDLIRTGARVVFDPGEILEELGIKRGQSAKGEGKSGSISEEEKKILNILQNETMHIDEIARSLNRDVAWTSATLLKMEISGLIQNLGSSNYCKS